MIQLDTKNTYSAVSKIFHWVRFLFFIAIYIIANFNIIDHRQVGLLFFLFICCNILWRLLNIYPDSYAESNLEKNIQRLIYIIMYILLFTIPILGYFSTFENISFGIFEIPSIYSFIAFRDYIQNYIGIHIYNFYVLLVYFHKVFVILLLILIGIHLLVIIINSLFKKNDEIKGMI